MKTEAQITERLEKLVTQINTLVEQIPAPNEKGEKQATPEQQGEICFLVASLLTIGWVLDCEEEMKPILRTFAFVGLAEKLGKV